MKVLLIMINEVIDEGVELLKELLLLRRYTTTALLSTTLRMTKGVIAVHSFIQTTAEPSHLHDKDIEMMRFNNGKDYG